MAPQNDSKLRRIGVRSAELQIAVYPFPGRVKWALQPPINNNLMIKTFVVCSFLLLALGTTVLPSYIVAGRIQIILREHRI